MIEQGFNSTFSVQFLIFLLYGPTQTSLQRSAMQPTNRVVISSLCLALTMSLKYNYDILAFK
jgi:hypothetical protein